ncbi:hypothetical protein NMY22_g11856 [Coprinellus aureogranulatus]|nr:hypothetical protein NMY22_g11856 [Coprinellus aureogranulatus]
MCVPHALQEARAVSAARISRTIREHRDPNVPVVSPGKARLAEWFAATTPQFKTEVVKDATALVLARKNKMCNIIEYKGSTVSAVTSPVASVAYDGDNSHCSNRTNTISISNLQQAYQLLDELVTSGELVDSSSKRVLMLAKAADVLEGEEVLGSAMEEAGFI